MIIHRMRGKLEGVGDARRKGVVCDALGHTEARDAAAHAALAVCAPIQGYLGHKKMPLL